MTTFLSDQAETQYVEGTTTRFAYRRIGPRSGVPLILCLRFRGTIDHWDPAFLEVLASERDVIIFDNRGTGLSSGTAPETIDGLAEGVLEFSEALGLDQIDLLGWSMGGFVVQATALLRPQLVRRLVVAGSGPGIVPDAPRTEEKVWQVALKPINDEEDFLYLFYPETETARQTGLASLRRLDTRLAVSHAVVSPQVVQAQFTAIRSVGTRIWDQLETLTLPVLVANGSHDMMISAFASYAMSQKLPHAKVILYSDAGHGFLFQHFEEFGNEVLRFLR